jgi:hypothetical protein
VTFITPKPPGGQWRPTAPGRQRWWGAGGPLPPAWLSSVGGRRRRDRLRHEPPAASGACNRLNRWATAGGAPLISRLGSVVYANIRGTLPSRPPRVTSA